MKNILGKKENLFLYNENKVLIYKYMIFSGGFSYEHTYDDNGNVLTFKNSDGYSYEFTRDNNGNELTYKDSNRNQRGFDVPEYTMEELVSKKETKDNVNPSHYQSKSGSQLKDVFNDFDLINFNINSAIAYLFRAGKKDDILQELGKAKKFIEFEEERIKLLKNELH